MKILFNTVMVKFDRENDELLLGNGHKLYLNTTYEPQQHAVTSGVVTAVPERIVFNRKDLGASMQYDVDMELRVGDRVIFDYKAESIVKQRQTPLDGSYALRYDDIYVAIRGDQIIPVNGVLLVEALPTTVEEDVQRALKSGLELPETVTKEYSEIMGVVRYLGAPCRGYLMADPDLTDIHDDIRVGDTVCFNPVYAIPLQYELHQIIDKGKVLYRLRRKDVLAICEPA